MSCSINPNRRPVPSPPPQLQKEAFSCAVRRQQQHQQQSAMQSCSLPGGRRFLSLDVLAAALFFSARALAFRMSCGLMPALYYSIFLRGVEREREREQGSGGSTEKKCLGEKGERQRGGKNTGGSAEQFCGARGCLVGKWLTAKRFLSSMKCSLLLLSSPPLHSSSSSLPPSNLPATLSIE